MILLVAMLAMVLVVASPALAQQSQVGDEGGAGDLNQAQCANLAIAGNQLQIASTGDQVGGNTVINQNCVANAGGEVNQINVQQGTADGGAGFKTVGTTVHKGAEVPVFVDTKGVHFVLVKDEVVVVEKAAVTFFDVTKVQYQYAVTQYQYAKGAAAKIAVLPDTGGASLITLGAGALLVAGGLLARRIVR